MLLYRAEVYEFCEIQMTADKTSTTSYLYVSPHGALRNQTTLQNYKKLTIWQNIFLQFIENMYLCKKIIGYGHHVRQNIAALCV